MTSRVYLISRRDAKNRLSEAIELSQGEKIPPSTRQLWWKAALDLKRALDSQDYTPSDVEPQGAA